MESVLNLCMIVLFHAAVFLGASVLYVEYAKFALSRKGRFYPALAVGLGTLLWLAIVLRELAFFITLVMILVMPVAPPVHASVSPHL